MAKEDGGHAFPNRPGSQREISGMSLRDYFAARAMAACVGAGESNQNYSGNPVRVATYAYEFADAMLAQRVK